MLGRLLYSNSWFFDFRLASCPDNLLRTISAPTNVDEAGKTAFNFYYFGKLNHPVNSSLSFAGSLNLWYSKSWGYRTKVTIPATQIGSGGVTTHTVLTTESGLPNNFWSHVKTDGSDIVCTSSNAITKLNRELVSIDTTNKKLILWTNVGSLSSSSDNYFYIYYGNASATETKNQSGTWDSNFIAVYHLCDNAANTTVLESANGLTGSSVRNTATMGQTTGPWGDTTALSFNGTSDAVTYANSGGAANINGGPATLEAWINQTSLASANDHAIVGYPASGVPYNYLFLYQSQISSVEQYDAWKFNGSYYNPGGPTPTTSAWHHVMVTTSADTAGTAIMYADGSTYGSSLAYTSEGSSNGFPLMIGYDGLGAGQYLVGAIQEARVSKIARSAAYATTLHNNLSSPSSFYSVGPEEVNPSPASGGNSYLQNLSAALNFVGKITRGIHSKHIGSLSFSGKTNKNIKSIKSASLSFSGITKKIITTKHNSNLNFVGNIKKNIKSTHLGHISFSGNIKKAITVHRSGILSFLGNVTSTKSGGGVHHIQNLSAALSFIGVTTKHTTSKHISSLSFIGAFNKHPTSKHSGTLHFSTSINKHIRSGKSSNLQFSGVINKHISVHRTATISFVSSLKKKTASKHNGQLFLNGNINKQPSKRFSANLNMSASISKHIKSTKFSDLTFSGNITKHTSKKISGSFSFIGKLITVSPINRIIFVTVQLNRFFSNSIQLNRNFSFNAYLSRKIVGSVQLNRQYNFSNYLSRIFTAKGNIVE